MRGIRAVPRNPRAGAGVSTPGASSAHGIGPDRRARHAGGSRRIRPHDRSATTSTVPRNRIDHPRLITRFAAVVTALAGAVLAFGAAAPAAFATLPPPEPCRTGDTAPAVIHTVIAGGMPGGKIILIAAAAAALAAVAAVLLARARATRRHMTAPGAYSAPPLPSAAAAGPGQTCRSPWRSSPPTSRPRMVPPRW